MSSGEVKVITGKTLKVGQTFFTFFWGGRGNKVLTSHKVLKVGTFMNQQVVECENTVNGKEEEFKSSIVIANNNALAS